MKAHKILIAALAVILTASAVWAYLLLNKPAGDMIRITQNGTVLYTIDLSREPDRLIEVEYEGRKNVIEIKGGRVRMVEADCPDHVCINTGYLAKGLPIICMPNRLVIEYIEDGSGLDGAA